MLPCFGEQAGGGGNSSDSSSSEISFSDIIQTLKSKKRELKGELRKVRKQILFLDAKMSEQQKEQPCPKPESKRVKLDKNQEREGENRGEEDLNVSISESYLNQCTFEYVGMDETEINQSLHASSEARETLKNENTSSGQKNVSENFAATSSLIENKLEKKSVIILDEDMVAKYFEQLQPGQTFNTFQTFEFVFGEYCLASFTNVRKDKSWTTKAKKLKGCSEYPYRRIEYQCVHFGSARKGNFVDGSRPNQSYNAVGCTFRLLLCLNAKKKLYEVREFCSDHLGHTPTLDSFKNYRKNKTLTEEESKLYIEKYMVDLKVPTRKIQEEIEKNTGKIPSGHNLRRYLQTANKKRGQVSDLQEVLSILDELKKMTSRLPYKLHMQIRISKCFVHQARR